MRIESSRIEEYDQNQHSCVCRLFHDWHKGEAGPTSNAQPQSSDMLRVPLSHQGKSHHSLATYLLLLCQVVHLLLNPRLLLLERSDNSVC